MTKELHQLPAMLEPLTRETYALAKLMPGRKPLLALLMRLLFIILALLADVHPVPAQSTLAIVPTNNQVMLFWPIPGGGTNGVLQSATDLVSPNWLPATDAFPVNYASRIAVSVTDVPAARFFRLSLVPPTADGMAFIPAGSFTMGDTLDGESDAIPTNVYVSAFYMDTNLVSYSLWQSVDSYATSHSYVFYQATYGPYVAAGKAANNGSSAKFVPRLMQS